VEEAGIQGLSFWRILSGHPQVIITAVTSEKSAGKSVSSVFPHLHKYRNLTYEPMDKTALLKKADLFFLALPHGASQEAVNFFFAKGKRVIDLSGRLPPL